jgi:UDP:flavonoid glycosyltransferase YjiC (YdhE family)
MVAQVINSGTPSVVVPMAHDQPDNGYLLEKLGVGKVVWMKEPKENIILNAIDLVLSSEEIKKANKKYSKLVQESKNGISKTADYIEDYID